MGTSKGKVRVRGSCTAGHTTEATSAPGRLTWEGTCGHEGCELAVKARRVPADTPKPPPQTKPAGTAEDPYRVKEVTSYGADDDRQRPRKRAAAKPAPAAAAAGAGPAGAEVPKPGAGAVVPAAPGGDDPADEPKRPAGKLTFRDRVAERRSRARSRDRGDFLEGILR